jgi:large subunit ribosomal protein L14e
MFDVGRICVKTAGRETGKFCVIVDVLEKGFVMVTGPRAVTNVKRRKCNIDHLEPTPQVIKLGKNASDDDVISAYKKDGMFEKFQVKPPSEKDIAEAKESERKRLAAAKEKPKKAAEEPEKAEVKVEEKHKEKPAKEEKAEHKPAKKEAKPKKAKAEGKPAKAKKKAESK